MPRKRSATVPTPDKNCTACGSNVPTLDKCSCASADYVSLITSKLEGAESGPGGPREAGSGPSAAPQTNRGATRKNTPRERFTAHWDVWSYAIGRQVVASFYSGPSVSDPPPPVCKPDWLSATIPCRGSGARIARVLVNAVARICRFRRSEVKESVPGTKTNHFSESVGLWVNGKRFAFGAWGGLRNKHGQSLVQLTLTGKACEKLPPGFWERLREFGQRWKGRITVFHLAADFFASEMCLYCLWSWYSGGFGDLFRRASSNGKIPKMSRRWCDEKGSTLELGSEESRRCVVFYEKGREQGDTRSRWVRCEIKWWHDVSQEIPWDVLRPPTWWATWSTGCLLLEYFVPIGAYLQPVSIRRIRAAVHESFLSWWLGRVESFRHSDGGFLRLNAEMMGNDLAVSLLSPPDRDCKMLDEFPDWQEMRAAVDAGLAVFSYDILITAAAKQLVESEGFLFDRARVTEARASKLRELLRTWAMEGGLFYDGYQPQN